jgi:flagellar hook-associated protein 1 FlgK
MADLLSTGLSGLLAFRRALDTTGHNIANANTDGYSRQRVEFATREATQLGSGYLGNGVKVVSVRRSFDEFLTTQMRGSASGLERLQAFASQADRINNLFSDGANGLAASLQKFSNAVQGASSNPSSLAARQVLLGESRNLADRFKYYDSQLRSIENDNNSRLTSEISEVSALAAGIAQLNGEIVRGTNGTGQSPNDLLDQRDKLLEKLSSKLSVQVVPQDGGAVNVFVGKGQALVLGSTANDLVPGTDPFDNGRPVVALRNAQNTVDITNAISGGSIGGLLDFRTQMLDPARAKLGRIAVGLADTVNAQHRAGMDLRGAPGTDLFSVGGAVAQIASTNTGNAVVTVARTDANALTGSDYILELNGSAYQLRDTTNNTIIPTTGTGTAADPLRAQGISIAISGSMAAGDRFTIRPTREAIVGLNLLIQDPANLAIACPIRTSAAAANTGSGVITAGVVTDPANAQLRSAVNIQFTSANTYSVNGSGSLAYTPGSTISLNGWQVQISGAPATGDQFTVSDNINGLGDNRNGQLLAAALDSKSLALGSASVNSSAAALVGEVGVTTNQADTSRDIQQALHQENVAAKENVSGVNLDEEAAQLLRFQQAYQALTQVIKTAGVLFDTLLAATR